MRRQVHGRSMNKDKDIQSKFEVAVRELEQIVQAAPPQSMPSCIGELERIKAVATQRLMTVSHPPTDQPKEKLLTIQGIAQYLQVPVYTARQFAKTKGFPAMRIGKHIRAELGALKVWARKHLKIEVDPSVYETYNKECDGRIDPQENQKKNGTHPGPTRQEVGGRRQYGRAVGAG